MVKTRAAPPFDKQGRRVGCEALSSASGSTDHTVIPKYAHVLDPDMR